MMHGNALLNGRWHYRVKGTGALVLSGRKFSTFSCCDSPASVARGLLARELRGVKVEVDYMDSS